ncbi:MAG: SDR family NAD(P)-dependent oxidoreductase [Saprospiraceae bacterium]|nr:SDR family NAD(P)-dependent oxidoreductase [Saprospiraceae bacterium]
MNNRRIALVTGAAKGIGRAIVERLIREDYFVVALDINAAGGEELVAAFGGENLSFEAVDVCNESEISALFSKMERLEVLVNNAGIIRDNMIWNMPAEDFDVVININLKGPWLLCKEAAVLMKRQNSGRIVNIASRAWLGNRGQTNYSASKAGVVGMTRALALELGKYNVCVNAVAPGLIDTPLTQNLEPAVLQKLIEAQPTRTMGKPEDVANVVAFLASPETRFITGQTIYVDGGKSIGAGW